MAMATGTVPVEGQSLTFEVPLDKSIGDESLQGAFAKFRKRKQVSSYDVKITIIEFGFRMSCRGMLKWHS